VNYSFNPLWAFLSFEAFLLIILHVFMPKAYILAQVFIFFTPITHLINLVYTSNTK